jgi:N utilization substance protein B
MRVSAADRRSGEGRFLERSSRSVSERSKGREIALQMLYQSDLGGSTCGRVFAGYDPAEYLGDEDESADREAAARGDGARALKYAKSLVRGALEHREVIDDLIRGQAEHWRLERMPAVDRNILRLAVYEFLYEPDVPKLVVINEAIELAKRYGSEDSGRFVNGLLDGLIKTHSFPGSLT